MIGINDSNHWALEIDNSPFKSLKTYRMLLWAYYEIKKYFSYRPLRRKEFNEQINIDKLSIKDKARYYADLGKKTTPIIPIPLTVKNSDDKYQTAVEYYRKSIKTGHFVEGILGQYL